MPDAFSPKIQRRLASTVPPRPMVEMKFSDAVRNLKHIFQECLESRRILDILSTQQPTSAENLKILLQSFSSRIPSPSPYGRACLSGPILGCEDATFQEFLTTNLAETVLPADALLDPINWTLEAPPSGNVISDPRYVIATTISRFTEATVQAPGGFIDMFKALLSNRCRVRRNLCRVLLGLENIQTKVAPKLDQVLMRCAQPSSSPNPLGTWVYLEKLRAIEMVIQLGFEMDIYLEVELAGMYWYVARRSADNNDGKLTKLKSLGTFHKLQRSALLSPCD